MSAYSEHEIAQTIVYWLGGMTQRDAISRAVGKPRAGSVACIQIERFIQDHGRPWAYNRTYGNWKPAREALDMWCRAQPAKPHFRLATKWL